MAAVWKALAEGDEGPTWNFMDGRALPVGPYSQDAEAGRGVIARRFAKGYKLHVISKIDGRIAAWRVTPLNVSEKAVADELIVEAKARGWLLADGNYDAGRLYDLACRHGAVLFPPLPKNAGGGHRPQSRMRLLAARLWEIPGAAQMYGLRATIERQFSQLSSFGGGLGPLPPWVRGLQRVTQWVGTKLMFYHVRLTSREAAARLFVRIPLKPWATRRDDAEFDTSVEVKQSHFMRAGRASSSLPSAVGERCRPRRLSLSVGSASR